MNTNSIFIFLLLIVNLESFISPNICISKYRQQTKNLAKLNLEDINSDNSTNIYIGSIADYKLLPIGNSTLLEKEPINNSLNLDNMIDYLSELVKVLNFDNKKEEIANFLNNSIIWDKNIIMDAVKDKLSNLDIKISKREMNILKKKYKENPKLFQLENLNNDFLFLNPIKKGKLIKMLEYLITKNLNKNDKDEMIEFIKYCRIYTNYVFIYKIDTNFIYSIVGEVNNKTFIVKGILRNYLVNKETSFLEIKDKLDNWIIVNNNEINKIDYSFLQNTRFNRYIFRISFVEND
jgi:hypothetical protein